MKLHTWAWLTWIICSLILVSSTRNPLYLVIIDLLLVLIQTQTGSALWSPKFFIRFALSIMVLSAVFNLIISRFGETILFTLPQTIPLLGGNYTLEAAVYGFTNGLVLIGMFTVFNILNQVIPVRSLVGLIPKAFQPIAVVTTIAITFIPNTKKQFFAIKEAQAIRGQQMKGIKDWLPLFIPLLIGGLERAMQVAEAMTAGGFVSKPQTTKNKGQRFILVIGLLAIVIGWLYQLNDQNQTWGWIILATGVILILTLFFISGSKEKRTRFNHEYWNTNSTILVICSVLFSAAFLVHFPGYQSLSYAPYPKLLLPELGIIQLAATLLLLSPLLFISGNQDVND